MAVPKTPAITWDTSFSKTITFPGPADFPLPKTTPVLQTAESRSGVRDTWLARTDYPVKLDVRYIPTTANVGSVNAYSASDGWQDFIAWAMKGNQFRVLPDKDTAGTYYLCYLLNDADPRRDEGGARYRLTLDMRSSTKVTAY